jgi:hypothetical protein
MLFEIISDGRPLVYNLDVEKLWDHVLRGCNMSWMQPQATDLVFYPKHVYNQHLWNRHNEAMRELKVFLATHKIEEKSVLWHVYPSDMRLANMFECEKQEYELVRRLCSYKLPGFIWENTALKNVKIKTGTTYGAATYGKLSYNGAWFRLIDGYALLADPVLRGFCAFEQSLSIARGLELKNQKATPAKNVRPPAVHWNDDDYFEEDEELCGAHHHDIKAKYPKKRPKEDAKVQSLDTMTKDLGTAIKNKQPMKSEDPIVGRFYRHYKGGIYQVKEHAGMIWEDGKAKSMVVFYNCNEQSTWIRSVDEWCEYVKRDGLWMPRFELLGQLDIQHFRGASDGK